jgi:hypothetical protein
MNQTLPVWDGTPKDAMRVFLENAMGVGLMAKSQGLDVTPEQLVSGIIDQIDKIARESYPLHNVISQSDLVMHAEGPGAAHDLPWLSALNWVVGTAESNLRKLSGAFFDLMGSDGKKLSRGLDIRLPGIAPGSIWIGIKLMPPSEDLLTEDHDLIKSLIAQIGKLPELIRFIDDEGLRPGIEEMIPDPAMRDVQLAALYRFSPTGRRGIHTLEIASTGAGSATLSQRERVVLKEAIDHPSHRESKAGSFIGLMQEADLDKTRLHLRAVPGVGTLRCVMPTLTASHARQMFGGLVRAEGLYQTDKEGRPRLLFVEKITPIEQGELI